MLSSRTSLKTSYLVTSLILVLIALSIVLGIRSEGALNVFQLTFGFGPVIQSLVERHTFCVIRPPYPFCQFATRMPLVPLMGAASALITLKTPFFIVWKNLVLWAVWAIALLRLTRRMAISNGCMIISLLLPLLSPYALLIAGRVNVEEGYLGLLLPAAFCFLAAAESVWDFALAGVTIAAIYLTKSSMALVCTVMVLWPILFFRKRMSAIPAIFLVLAVALWGGYIKHVSGTFAVGNDASSWNGGNFYKANNPWARALYPRQHLDALDSAVETNHLLPYWPVANEWELSHAQLVLGRSYASQHKLQTLRMDGKKLLVACCYLQDVEGQNRLPEALSIAGIHAVTLLALGVALYLVATGNANRVDILFTMLAIAYLVPYIVGFLYVRHLVPLFFLACPYLMLVLKRFGTMNLPGAWDPVSA